MKPILFDGFSTCCEGMILLSFRSILAVPSLPRLSVLLTSRMACTGNASESVKGTHTPREMKQADLWGQQYLRSEQQIALAPKGQQK